MKSVIQLLLVVPLVAAGCVQPYDGTKDLPPVCDVNCPVSIVVTPATVTLAGQTQQFTNGHLR